jgi:putative ABC transport system substrate-binding protein
MRKNIFCIALGAMLFAFCFPAEAQQASKVPHIGILFIGGRNQPHLEAFKQGLRERGYTEGKNIAFEYRYAEGREDRLPVLAAELVHLKVDVIVVTADVSAQAAQQATKTIPIVVTTGDPVAWGLADSLAKPGGNVTGLSVLLADLSGKRVEILRETFPKLARLATLWNPAERVATPVFKETSAAAQALSLQLHSFEVQTLQDIERAFSEIPKLRSSALLVLLSPLVTLHSQRIVEMALKQQLPGMYPTRQFAEEGGLMAYGPLIGDLYRRAATYVDKILKGSKPADLPVEQPMKFELVINLKTAKQIGVTIPPNVLARADRVMR